MSVDRNTSILYSFGLIADIHHSSIDSECRHCSKSLERLRLVLGWMEKRGMNLIINLGDAINHGPGQRHEVDYVKAVGTVLASFRGQIKTLIGNHDIEALTKTEFITLLGCDSPCSFEQQGIRFIMLDGNHHVDGSDFLPGNFTWDQAYLGIGQLEMLEYELGQSEGKPTLIFCHECLDYIGVSDPHLVKDSEKARAIINQFPNVMAVIQGHYHFGRSAIIDSLPYLTLASLVVVDAEGIEQSAAAIIHVLNNGSLKVEGFGRQPSLTLSRQK